MSSVNAPWSPKRFLKTLAYFEVIPFLGCLNRLLGRGAAAADSPPVDSLENPVTQASTGNDRLLFDFTQADATVLARWGALDDVVMGGVSESQLRLTEQGALFAGVVSTANSGGFVSVRTRNFSPALDLAAYQGIQLRLRGDGKRYKLFLRSSPGWDSLAYASSFDTIADEWMTVKIPFADLRPVFRARTVETSDPFNPAQVCSLQLMLSKFEYDGELNPHFAAGEFGLLIAAIAAYGDTAPPQGD